METIEQHEVEKHSYTPITWEFIRTAVVLFLISWLLTCILWLVGGFLWGVPLTATTEVEVVRWSNAVSVYENGETIASITCKDNELSVKRL